jgi:hypothetical protein
VKQLLISLRNPKGLPGQAGLTQAAITVNKGALSNAMKGLAQAADLLLSSSELTRIGDFGAGPEGIR